MRRIAMTSAVGLIAGAFVFTGSASAIAEPASAEGATARQPVAAQPAATLAVHRKSSKCKSPAGQRFNVSWGDGSQSTTFYFNNHCNSKRRIVVRSNYGSHKVLECIVTNPHTKGRKKIDRQTDAIEVSLPQSNCP